MKKTISNMESIIDSRDIIARIEELESLIEDNNDLAEDEREDLTDEEEELAILQKVAEEGENSPDWSYGESLISEDYFIQYIEELIDDCYEMHKEMNSSAWPWRHITIDYAAAADEAKQDYFEIDFDGQTFYIRA